MEWIRKQIDDYCRWLKDNTIARKDTGTGWYAISTPFIGMFNDHIEIYVKKTSDFIYLSDDGETLNNLSFVGVDFTRSEKRKEMLDSILRTYGVSLENGELTVKASVHDFPFKKHSLVTAIMNVCDLEFLATRKVASIFSDDVRDYLDSKDVRYNSSIYLRGNSGLDYNFNFCVAGRETELGIKTYEIIKQDYVTSFLYCMSDVQNARKQVSKKKFKSLIIINDRIREPSSKLVNILKENDVDVVLWSEKQSIDRLIEVP